MLSIAFYNIILYSSTLFVWLSEKINSNSSRKIFLFFSFLIIFLPSALRYGVGTDFFNYLFLYEGIYPDEGVEFGFILINSFLQSMNADPQWAFGVYAFIFTFVAYLGFPKEGKWICFFMFVMVLWFDSLNGIRQSIAVSFSILAYKFLLKKNLICFLFLTVIGSLIHVSILILLPLAIFSLLVNNNFFRSKLVILIMLVTVFVILYRPSIAFEMMEKSLIFLNFDKYALYFGHAEHFIETGGTKIVVATKIIFSFYAIKIFSEKSHENYAYRYMILIFFFYALSLALAAHVVIFSRMSSIFCFCLVCGMPLVMHENKKNLIGKLFIVIFIFLQMMSFFKASVGIPTEYSDPMVNPYQTFFMR